MVNEDTIAAVSTAMSDAGIGIIRISGSKSIEVADKYYINGKGNHDLFQHETNSIKYGFFIDSEGTTIDEIMISVMKAPHSYTTEDTIEINAHGGMTVISEILDILICDEDCRLAMPGEFTKRAFIGGRIDLSQAEAVMDTISAQNKFSLRNSQMILQGKLRKEISQMREDILYETAYIEAAIDDPENYDLSDYTDRIKSVIEKVSDKCKKLIDSSDEGIIRKNGINTAIIGKPNVGKSSLLNALVGEEKAIVTDIAGTTRDAIEESIRLDDVVLKITDTAGIRNTDDIIEKIGVKKSFLYADDAALILLILDSEIPFDNEDLEIIKYVLNKNLIIILNKHDLEKDEKLTDFNLLNIINRCNSDSFEYKIDYDGLKTNRDFYRIFSNKKLIPVIRTSLIENSEIGIQNLKKAVNETIFHGNNVNREELYITSLRQKNALKRAYDSLLLVEKSIDNGVSEDFYTIDLLNAYKSFGEITGEDIGDDLTDEIFSKFCMGK